MTDTSTTLEAKTQTANPEVTKAELMISLTKEGLAYQQLLQDSENVVFTKDNLNEERSALVNLRKVKKKLEDAENPFTERWKSWNAARKSLVDPVLAVLTKKETEYRKIANEVLAENAKIEAEKQRVAAIKLSIDNFFIEQSQIVANATTPAALVAVEKLIGSHRRASRYEGFYDLMDAKASNLTELIKSQKEALRKLEGLKSAENAAQEAGDDQAVLDSREAQEQVQAKIHEAKEVVQSTAVNMATNSEVTEVEVITPVAPKPRRTSWRYEVLDIKLAQKAGLTETLINETKVDVILAEKRKNDNECTENGIRYYKHFEY